MLRQVLYHCTACAWSHAHKQTSNYITILFDRYLPKLHTYNLGRSNLMYLTYLHNSTRDRWVSYLTGNPPLCHSKAPLRTPRSPLCRRVGRTVSSVSGYFFLRPTRSPVFFLFSVTLGWVSVGLLEPDKASKSMPHSAADAAAVVIESRSRSVGLAVPDTIY